MCALVSFLTHPRLYFGFLIPLIRWYIFKVKVFILCLSSLYLLNYHYLVFKALMLLLSSFSRVRLFSDPIDLPRPWDSPGKNTGVGCHLLQCMKVKSEREVAQSCPTPSDSTDCNLRGSSVHGTFQTRVLEWGASAFS